MNENKEATQVTVSTDQRSDFSAPVGQTDLGDNGVVVEEEGQRTFIPYDNVIHITYELEEVEEPEVYSEPEEDVEETDEGDEDIKKEPITVTESFKNSIDENRLEEDYTVEQLAVSILPQIEDPGVIKSAIEVDDRSTAVEEYEDRLEDFRDEGQ